LFEEVDVDIFVISSDELKTFLNSKEIFIDGFNDKEFENPNNENLYENTQLKNTIANLELDVAIEKITVKELNEKIQKLKVELLEKDQKIKELELSPQKDDKDLMNLIFDETATDRYAPDLANSIKLWKYLYIDNQEIKGKHSYRANHWIKQNTSYQQESSVEVKRLREVTSPFDSWHIDRKNKFNK